MVSSMFGPPLVHFSGPASPDATNDMRPGVSWKSALHRVYTLVELAAVCMHLLVSVQHTK